MASENYNTKAEEVRYLAASYDAATLSRRLGFSANLEGEFRQYFAIKFNENRLQALCMVVVLFFLSAALDFFNAPQNWLKISLYKYAIGLLVIVAYALIANSRWFAYNAQKLTWLALILLLIALLGFAQLCAAPRLDLYLPAVVVLVIGAGLLPRLLLAEFASFAIISLVFCNLCLYLNSTDSQVIAAFNIYIGVASLLALFLSYFFERAARKHFINKHLLELERRELAALSDDLSNLANIDPATGLGNFAHLNKCLEMEWYRAIRNHKPLSIFSVDIDYFSEIVQLNGEKLAQDCLVAVGKSLEQTFKRAADMVARYKKDGFLVLLPETNSANASALANRACANVRKLQFEYAKGKFVTVSIGQVSVEPHELQDADDIIKKADAALYLAKRNGRNGYYVYSHE